MESLSVSPSPASLSLVNDAGVAEIRVGNRTFRCIGATPPFDHPHVRLDMGEDDSITCPYCGTLYRFDDSLAPNQSDPPEAIAFSSADRHS